MGEIILTAAVLLLALYGCAHMVRQLCGRLLGDGRRQAVLLLPLSGTCEDAEYRIRSCLHTARDERLRLFVLDDGLDAASRDAVAGWVEQTPAHYCKDSEPDPAPSRFRGA